MACLFLFPNRSSLIAAIKCLPQALRQAKTRLSCFLQLFSQLLHSHSKNKSGLALSTQIIPRLDFLAGYKNYVHKYKPEVDSLFSNVCLEKNLHSTYPEYAAKRIIYNNRCSYFPINHLYN